MSDLDRLSRGFRSAYLSYEDLTAQLRAWAEAFEDLIALESVGRSPEGRELWRVTVGPQPERIRPAVWVDANMHASELAGSSVALSIIEDVLRLHLQPDTGLHGLSTPVRDALREVLFVVMPRISPDGAEAVLHQGHFVRSVPRDARPQRTVSWHNQDLDGDGLCLMMRKPDETGDYVESRRTPGLMVPREIDDEGPFYKLYPEGIIDPWNGRDIPTPGWLSNNDPDLNRNFPYAWAPAHRQAGAGPYPLSEPESRAVASSVVQRPNLFAWLNLHTFGGVFIRPLGDRPDTAMDPGDLAVFRQIEAWSEALTGYPMVSGFADFTYEPDKPLHGDLTDFAYHARGCIAYVCELWDLFAKLGFARGRRFVDAFFAWDRDRLEALHRWDAEHNGGRIFVPWRPVQHPQLGPVDVGGFDPRIGIWNPPPEYLPEICRGQSAAFLRVGAMVPRLWVSEPAVHDLGQSAREVALVVENRGYLPTFGLPSSRELDFNEPIRAIVEPGDIELVETGSVEREVGHLQGWGRGAMSGFGSPVFPWSQGEVSRKHLSWVVRGTGTMRVRIGNCRLGWHERCITIG